MLDKIHSRLFLHTITTAVIVAMGTALFPMGEVRADDPAILTVCKALSPACQYTTLQAAIDAANAGDEIRIATGEYSDMITADGLTQIATITKPLTIKGGYNFDFTARDTALTPTILDANRAGRVLVIDGVNPVTIDGLTITEGRAINKSGWGCKYGTSPNPTGGGIFIRNSNVTITNTRFIDNTAGYYTNEQGCGGGLYADNSTVTVAYSYFSENTGSTNQGHYSLGGGMALIGGTGFVSHSSFVNNYGSDSYGNSSAGAILADAGVFSIEENLFEGNVAVDGGAVFASSTVSPGIIIRNNTFTGNTGSYFGGALGIAGLTTVEGNLFTNNTNPSCGGALCVRPGTHYLNNNVFIGNSGNYNGGAIGMTNSSSAGDTVYMSHNTITNNTGNEAVHTCSWCTVTMTNTIIANSTTGINHTGTSSSKFQMTNTLFYNNTTDLVGAFTNTNPLSGDPAFDTDGYHLTAASAAIDQGVTTSLSVDIDGDSRLRGSAPDIGADESPFSQPIGQGIALEKIAANPRWINRPASLGGGYTEINYYMRFLYGDHDGTNPAISELTLEDTLPAELSLDRLASSDILTYANVSGVHTWTATEPLEVGDWVWMEMHTSTAQAGGLSLRNTLNASFKFGDETEHQLSASADSVLPVFPPLLNSPESGEICHDEILIAGQAQPGALIQVYANGSPVTTVTADADTGLFSKTIPMSVNSSTAITATAELNSVVSGLSTAVVLEPTSQFWCPQTSFIQNFRAEGIVVETKFRGSNGKLSATEFSITGPAGQHQFNLMPCDCPAVEGVILPPTEIYIDINGTEYHGTQDLETGYWMIDVGAILGRDMVVNFIGVCNGEPTRYRGGTASLIDPDGYVFDIDQGFDAAHPETSVIEDITVTAYAYLPDLGGWVQWPAYLYGQTNPQITNTTFADGVLTPGYFAFFTPPGKYYLEATAGQGYQAWRSPEIVVVADPVHMNIPLTAWSSGSASQVLLTPTGPDQANLSIHTGDTVEWVSWLESTTPLADLLEATQNPTAQSRSESQFDPLISSAGFDSGVLQPGQVYRRQFATAGVYTYSDGQGHTAQVTVTEAYQKFFIPVVTRP